MRVAITHNGMIRIFEMPVVGLDADVARAITSGAAAFGKAFTESLAQSEREHSEKLSRKQRDRAA